MTFFPYVSPFCDFSDCWSQMLNNHIGCNDVVSPRCVSKCAFSDVLLDWLNSCTVCTCAVSPQCELWSGFSSLVLDWTTCCTVHNCTSWLQCGFAYVAKGFVCVQMSLDIGRKISDLSFLLNERFCPTLGWLLKVNSMNSSIESESVDSLYRKGEVFIKLLKGWRRWWWWSWSWFNNSWVIYWPKYDVGDD